MQVLPTRRGAGLVPQCPSMFPAFTGRSRSEPARELRDPAEWERMWLAARARLAEDQPEAFNRWDPDSPVCT